MRQHFNYTLCLLLESSLCKRCVLNEASVLRPSACCPAMKLRLVLFALAGIIVVMAACRKKEVAPSSGPPPTPEFDSSENNLGYLNEGVRKFQQAKNRPPNDLDELVTEEATMKIPGSTQWSCAASKRRVFASRSSNCILPFLHGELVAAG